MGFSAYFAQFRTGVQPPYADACIRDTSTNRIFGEATQNKIFFFMPVFILHIAITH